MAIKTGRREFLASLGAIGAALAAPKQLAGTAGHVSMAQTDRATLLKAAMRCMVDGQVSELGAVEATVTSDFFETDAPVYTSVAGYSADDRWVLLREVVPCGGLPDEVYANILDIRERRNLRLPILVQPDDRHEADELPRNQEYDGALRKAMDRIGFLRPQILLRRYDFIHCEDAVGAPDISFELGEDLFDLVVTGDRDGRALVIENRRFSPGRRATLFRPLPDAMPYFGSDFETVGIPKELRGVCELVASPSGNSLSIGVITNQDHPCWGAASVSHLHVPIRVIRQHCTDLLAW